jgi:C4-dicarboxylate-specific signal transduction histidine kinase
VSLPRHHTRRTEMIDQQRDKLLRAFGGKIGGEMKQQHCVRACCAEQSFALIERGEAEGRRIGPEQAHRVGIERRDDDGAAFGPRPVYRAADHRLMPAVKAIEIAERHDAPAQMRRYRPGIVQAHHMARL